MPTTPPMTTPSRTSPSRPVTDVRPRGPYPVLEDPMTTASPLHTPLRHAVMSRITGWTAHITEQLAHNALIRPPAS